MEAKNYANVENCCRFAWIQSGWNIKKLWKWFDVKSSWQRPTCRGDLQLSRFGELILQATSLWELAILQLRGVITGTVLGFYPRYYAIVRGGEMRMRVERSMSAVKGESIICVATSKSKWKERNKMTQEWRKRCSMMLLLLRYQALPLMYILGDYHLCHRLVWGILVA